MTYIIGIDIGTGSTKAVSINKSGEIQFSTSASYPTLHPDADTSEQDPELIWKAFKECIQKTINALGKQPEAISLSSAMHSVIAVDAEGNALMNMITWADNRSANVAKRLRELPQGEDLYKHTGTPIHSMSPLCKLIWLRESRPSLFHSTHKFISIKEFIWYKMFSVFEIDHSIASATGLFDIERLTWYTDALTLAGIDESHLSAPVSTSHQRSGATLNGIENINPEVCFVIGASDGCLANLGTFAIEPGVAALTIGTSGAIRVGNTKPTYNFNAMTFNYRLDENTIITGGPVNNGGGALKWYAESLLKIPNTSSNLDTLISPIKQINAGADGLLFLPYLLGERAPIWDSEACGVFFGITGQHTQAHFTRAVLEGITFALYDVASAMEESALAILQINVSGGFVRSPEWVQLLSDIFNKKVCITHAEDASALGAAFMALKSLSLIDSYDSLMPGEIATFQPNEQNHAVYQKSFVRYKKLYTNLKELMV